MPADMVHERGKGEHRSSLSLSGQLRLGWLTLRGMTVALFSDACGYGTWSDNDGQLETAGETGYT
jgi:hypothetical protein